MQMMGRISGKWGRHTCDCCNWGRGVKAQRQLEKRQWRREWEDEKGVQEGERERPIGYVERWPHYR